MSHHREAELRSFGFDLTHHEAVRRAAVVTAIGDGWDPGAVLAGEEEAHRLLYSGLDEEQQQTYDRLVAAGVLPARQGDGRAAD
ncbi:DUF6400 family protein [Streptomyces sp. NPDC006984]|uniref:DUF6400 family protein n=1 Tax=Streptomyces sp. NPDC006984 TaxID=3155463 RepID=UPI0033FF165B